MRDMLSSSDRELTPLFLLFFGLFLDLFFFLGFFLVFYVGNADEDGDSADEQRQNGKGTPQDCEDIIPPPQTSGQAHEDGHNHKYDTYSKRYH